MARSKHGGVYIAIVLGAILLNFVPIRVFDYPLTVAPFVTVYLLQRFVRISEVGFPGVLILIFITVWTLGKSVNPLVFENAELLPFVRTLFLWIFYICSMTLAFNPLKNASDYSYELRRGAEFSLWLVLICVCFQYVYYSITGDVSVFALWGEYSFASQDYVLRAIYFGANKATAFYLEPSTLGLVTSSLFTVATICGSRWYSAWCAVFIAVLSGSAAAIFTVLLILTVSLLKGNSKDATLVSRAWLKVAIIVLLSLSILYSAPYLMVRVSDLFVEGTSSNYRLIAPLQVLADVLLDSPFGTAFGLMEEHMLSYSLLNGSVEGSTLDNGWYLLVFYYGWAGLFVFAISTICLVYIALRCNKEAAVTALFFLCSPFFNGASFSPEMLFLQVLVIFAFRIGSMQSVQIFDYHRNV